MIPTISEFAHYIITFGTVCSLIMFIRLSRTFTADMRKRYWDSTQGQTKLIATLATKYDDWFTKVEKRQAMLSESIGETTLKFGWVDKIRDDLEGIQSHIVALRRVDDVVGSKLVVIIRSVEDSKKINAALADEISECVDQTARNATEIKQHHCALNDLNISLIPIQNKLDYLQGRLDGLEKMIATVITQQINVAKSSDEPFKMIDHHDTAVEELGEDELLWWLTVAVDHKDIEMLIKIDTEIDLRKLREHFFTLDKENMDKAYAMIAEQEPVNIEEARMTYCAKCGVLFNTVDMITRDDEYDAGKLFCMDCDNLLDGGITSAQR